MENYKYKVARSRYCDGRSKKQGHRMEEEITFRKESMGSGARSETAALGDESPTKFPQ